MSNRSAALGIALALAMAVPNASVLGQNAGNFSATVGLASGTPVELSGFAMSFGSRDDEAWYVQLIIPGGASSILIFYAGVRPPIGEHPIVDLMANDFKPPPGKVIATGNVDPQLFVVSGFHSLGGTMIVTESSASSVEGTFQYEAREASTGQVVTVEGTFTTKNQES
jgi:hypothetical protein